MTGGDWERDKDDDAGVVDEEDNDDVPRVGDVVVAADTNTDADDDKGR